MDWLDKSKLVRTMMISQRIQNYINDYAFCSEYLFKDWESFLDLLS